jgi:hypothetical protein
VNWRHFSFCVKVSLKAAFLMFRLRLS